MGISGKWLTLGTGFAANGGNRIDSIHQPAQDGQEKKSKYPGSFGSHIKDFRC